MPIAGRWKNAAKTYTPIVAFFAKTHTAIVAFVSKALVKLNKNAAITVFFLPNAAIALSIAAFL